MTAATIATGSVTKDRNDITHPFADIPGRIVAVRGAKSTRGYVNYLFEPIHAA
jgi:hypothetical protein